MIRLLLTPTKNLNLNSARFYRISTKGNLCPQAPRFITAVSLLSPVLSGNDPGLPGGHLPIGEELTVFHLKGGMNLTATIVTTPPETMSHSSSISGTAPVEA